LAGEVAETPWEKTFRSQRLPTPPEGDDYRREQRSGKPIEKLAEDDKRMKVNVDRVSENDGQSEHAPASKGESYSAAYPGEKVRTLITRDDREKESDSDCGEDVQRAGKRVTSPSPDARSAESVFGIDERPNPSTTSS
jgi:hypothetical protein